MLLNRKNSLSFSFTTWSNRALVELSEFGLDQLPINWAIPSPKFNPFALGSGKAFSALFRGAGALARNAASGTKLAVAACG